MATNLTLFRIVLLGFFLVIFNGCKEKSQQNLPISTYSNERAVIDKGQDLAKQYCYSCHKIEQAGIGPALGGVTFVHDKNWLYNFIKAPSEMVAKGDKKAIALFEKYKNPMPGFPYLSDGEIEAILSYINSYSTERHVEYNPKGNGEKMKKLMTIPSEPIPKTALSLKLSNFVSFPFEDNAKIVRFSNMRYKPKVKTNQVYVNNHDGQLYSIIGNSLQKELDLKDHFPNFISNPGLATGFGSFAFHPDFENNHLVYITHAEKPLSKPSNFEYEKNIPVELQWVLSEFKLENKDSFNKFTSRELLRINFPRGTHGVQDINFDWTAKKGDEDYGALYIGIGDGGATQSGFPELCHNLNSPLGTILRINPTVNNVNTDKAYSIPNTNPYAKNTDPKIWKEIYAYGFRNPHRFTWYEDDRRFLSSEISRKAFEEINWIKPGKDYGWNIRDANIKYDAKNQKYLEPVPWDEPEPNYELPYAVYSHFEGRAISGGFIYRGSIPELKDKYIFGDIVSGRIFYINLKNNTKPLQFVYEFGLVNENGEEGTLLNWVGDRVDLRFGEDASGELYIMTKTDGKIRKIIDIQNSKLK